MQQLTVRLHFHNYIDDCPVLLLSEYRNFITSEKQETLTKETPMEMVK